LQTKLIFFNHCIFCTGGKHFVHLYSFDILFNALNLSTRTDLQNLNAVTVGFLYRSFRVQQDHDSAFYLAIMFFPEDHTASLVPTY